MFHVSDGTTLVSDGEALMSDGTTLATYWYDVGEKVPLSKTTTAAFEKKRRNMTTRSTDHEPEVNGRMYIKPEVLNIYKLLSVLSGSE